MTCVVVLKQGTVVWIGGDSSGTGEFGERESLKNPKIFARRDPKGTLWLFGYSGDYPTGQLTQFKVTIPSAPTTGNGNLTKLIVTDFVPDLRNCLLSGGALGKGKNGSDKMSGALIIAVNGEIFVISESFGIQIPNEPYTAIGSGGEIARGALGATKGLLDNDPKERLTRALEQAQECHSDVNEPFLIMNSDEAEDSVRYVRSRRKRKR